MYKWRSVGIGLCFIATKEIITPNTSIFILLEKMRKVAL